MYESFLNTMYPYNDYNSNSHYYTNSENPDSNPGLSIDLTSHEDNTISPIYMSSLYNSLDILHTEKQTKSKTYEDNNIKEEKKTLKHNKFKVENYSLNENKSSDINNKNIKLGRKTKDDKTEREHNRCTDDNLIKKCKHIVIDSIMVFINEKIKILYNNNIGNSIFKKQLLMLNKDQKSNGNAKYNKDFLQKTLREIFSEDISTKYSNYNSDHNKVLIETLINEKNEEKRNYFQKLFSLTFLQCLKHFRKSEYIEELNGLQLFQEFKNGLNDDNKNDNAHDDYKILLEFYINSLEDIIMRKKSRKREKK